MVEKASLQTWDIVTIVLYFVIVMATGIGATVRANRNSVKGFFLAGKSMTFLPIAGSIFATNVGAPMFIGVAGSAAAFGFAPVMFEWHATYMLVILGWVFVPIYIASGTFTMPEYLRKRFGGKRLRIYYAVVQLVLIILSGISTEMYAGSLFVDQLFGWNMYASVGVLLAITAIYTIGGGLAAVIYTDAIQTVILVAGSLVLTIMSMDKIGGYEAMVNQFRTSASPESIYSKAMYNNLTCGFPPDNAFSIFRSHDSGDYPWPGLVFGLTLLATYFFCTNQVIVQRNLAAKDVSHSKAACVIASYLKILPFFLFVWPGMISRILYPDEIGCTDPDSCRDICKNAAGCTNIAYPVLVLRILPTGVRGLMLAGLLAALMSSLTSQFNSASTIFTMDLWKHCRPHASEFENVLVGRMFGLFMIGLSIAWLPVLSIIQGGQLWDYLQAISAYITPAWVVVFLLAMFWKRCTEPAAFYSLMVGLAIGIARMGVHFGYSGPSCGGGGPDLRPEVFTKIHYLHFALILGGVTLVCVVVLSMFTQPRPARKLHRVTWWTRNDVQEPECSSSSESSCEDEDFDRSLYTDVVEQKRTCGRKTYNFMCGSNDGQIKLKKSEKLEQRRIMSDIKEDPYWSRVCDINAVIAVALTCLAIGFYS